jgi:hypothetical protein
MLRGPERGQSGEFISDRSTLLRKETTRPSPVKSTFQTLILLTNLIVLFSIVYLVRDTGFSIIILAERITGFFQLDLLLRSGWQQLILVALALSITSALIVIAFAAVILFVAIIR